MKRVGLVIVFAALGAACSLLNSFDNFEGATATTADAGADRTVVPGDEPTIAVCAHRRWPDPPDGGPAGDIGERVGAVNVLHIVDDMQGGEVAGFDLDGLCTCPDAPACTSPAGQPSCDVPGTGIDNAARTTFTTFAQSGVSLDDQGVQTGLTSGKFGVVLRLSGWNGATDDDSVKLELFNAIAVNPDAGASAKFDGADTWVIDEDDATEPIAPFTSQSAYVRGGVLVARFAFLTIKTRTPTAGNAWLALSIVMANAVVSGKLDPVGAASTLTLRAGSVAGRMRPNDVLAQAQRALKCATDSPVYRALEALICNARDLPLNVADDGKGLPCQTISAGFGLETIPAKIGAKGHNDDPDACAPAPQCE